MYIDKFIILEYLVWFIKVTQVIYLLDVRDCKDILQKRVGRTSGVYQIFIDVNGTLQQFQVYCDMVTEGGGWTVCDQIHSLLWQVTCGNFIKQIKQ